MNYDNFEIERKVSLREVIDAYFLWMFAAKNNWLDKTAKAEVFCTECLEYTWGKGSRIEFNYETLEMRCYGPENQFVCITEKDLE
jgi:hypothetical protein